ncbi:hypothetical protein RAAC3_TM7C00001G0499 [Candidatus Saccharibacteria bacterium RAAC3_TM7_1]|nr:hypothetical protein RAAC3_TM7C00001G0499 [Candidatus Saccharibacteria bacterium RAAC3_TM7_1]
MFRKLVSNLPFSPALVGQLGFYAKRLRKEEATRRLGLIFTALALVVQSFAIFSPPEAANAASSADFVRGGVSSSKEFLRYYDGNINNIKDVYTSLGITRGEIADTKSATVREPGHYNWSLTSLYSYAQGQRSWSFKKSSGGTGTVYYRPMALTEQGGPVHPVLVGHSKTFGWFAIKKDCGNLITSKPPQVPPKPMAACQNLTVEKLSRTKFRFVGRSTDKNGAVIKGYTYAITNNRGVNIKTIYSSSTVNRDSVTYEQTTEGKYHVELTVRTSEGKKSDASCRESFTVVPKKPVVICKNVVVEISNRSIVSLSGYANANNGAKIKAYVFIVTDKTTGKVVKRMTVTSQKEAVLANSFELSKVGKYQVTLKVQTSEGTVSDAEDCVKSFTIAKPQVCSYNPSLPPSSPDCQPCPGNPDIWVKDERCDANIIMTKTTTNMTQGNVNATTITARASDKISYTLTAENRGVLPQDLTIRENLADVLEYAKLIDLGGGTFDSNSNTLSWPEVTLFGGNKQSRTIVVELLSAIPATNTGTSNEDSFDCRMVNTFGNSVDINVTCPTQKVIVEQVVSELPRTGARENMIFAGVLLAVVTYFYARSRQLGKEIRLIRRGLNTGAL